MAQCELNMNVPTLGDVKNWKIFKMKIEIYINAMGVKEDRKSAMLLFGMGEIGIELLEPLKLSMQTEYSVLIQKFEEHFLSKVNVNFERYIFFNTKMKPEQKFIDYIAGLQNKSKDCGFDNLRDSLIVTQLICGMNNDVLREKLLREKDVDLTKATEMCKLFECNKAHLQVMKQGCSGEHIEKDTTVMIDMIKQDSHKYKDNTNSMIKGCRFCGYDHEVKRCPAYGKTCNNCGRLNHFQARCKAKKILKSSSSEKVDYVLNIDNVALNENCKPAAWNLNIQINGQDVCFNLDTGAMVNILPYYIFLKLGIQQPIKKCKNILTSYSGNSLNVLGMIELMCTIKHKFAMIEFYVVKTQSMPILGLKSCVEQDLVKRVNQVKENELPNSVKGFADVFNGMGKLSEPYHIELNENVQPRVHHPRKIPFSLMDKVKQELDKMEKDKIIEKVDYPTAWVSPIVVARKPNNDIRLCLDTRELNKFVKREYFEIPTLDEFMAKMNGAQVFSKLDAFSGFWQIPLDNESADLCTFSTPWTRYRFLRLPFGICSASEIFHKRFKSIFSNIEGVDTYIDDLIVWGRTQEEHDSRLRSVLERAREVNLRFKLSKCEFNKSEVKYLGHVFGKFGIKIDQEKVKSIQEMPPLTNKKEVERFMGMCTYVSKFIPNFSDKTAPIRELLKNKVAWHWDNEQEDAFNELKSALSTAPVLKYYDVSKPLTVSVDSSMYGVGAVLLQEGHPVYYASKSYSETEKRWANIEKEFYAVLFGLTKFHQFVYGRIVTVETDHKPLLFIMKKQFDDCPARLKRMLYSLQKYEFNLVYRPGKQMYVSDFLSRAPVQCESNDLGEKIELEVNQLVCSISMTEERMKQFQDALLEDDELRELMSTVYNGWPLKKSDLNPMLYVYWPFRHEIYVASNVLFKRDRIIVPRTLKHDMLNKIHVGHFGLDVCLRRAKEVLYWPGMTNDITNVINNCQTCWEHKKSNSREPMIIQEQPQRPWEKLGIDLFKWNNHMFVAVGDYFSKFVDFAKISDETSETVIREIKMLLSRYGVPKQIVTDQGPQFTSQAFKNFCNAWDINHTLISPKFPQANGFIERQIQTLKSLLTKCKESRSDAFLALIEWRNTPFSDIPSPAEIMYNRQLRSIVPVRNEFLEQRPVNNNIIRKSLEVRQEKSKSYYDKSASHSLSDLKEGEMVMIQMEPGSRWVDGEIVRKASRPRSYVIRTAKGVIERNRKMIKPKVAYRKEETDMTPKNVEYEYKFYDSYVPKCPVVPDDDEEEQLHGGNDVTLEAVDENVISDEAENVILDEENENVILDEGDVAIERDQEEVYVTRFGRRVHPPERYSP